MADSTLPSPIGWQPEPTDWRRRWSEVFGIDLRALAAYRIAIAFLLLLNLCNRLGDLTAHYTDDGVLPRTARVELYNWGGQDGGRYLWSLHHLSGEAWGQRILFGISAVFAGCLLVGYRTRLATIVSWLLFLSLNGRNPMINDGGDLLLEAMLLWSIFLPLGAVWSLDRRAHPPAAPLPRRVMSVATAAALLQLGLMYWFGAAFKLSDTWSRDYTAIYYVMNIDIFATRLALLLREYPAVMAALTFLTVWIEWIVPTLAFFPFFTAKLRTFAVFCFWGFHLSLAATLELGLFSWFAMACWILFLPTGFWDWLSARNIPWSRFVPRLPAVLVSASRARAESPTLRTYWPIQIGVGALFTLVYLWNVRSLDYDSYAPYTVPKQCEKLVRVLGLDQQWTMFAPGPLLDDGWFEMTGVLRDGSVVNLWQPGEPRPSDKPDLVSATYVNQRWRKYLANLSFRSNELHKDSFAAYLRRRWDAEFAKGDPERQVVKLTITYHLETTPPPGSPPPEAEPRPWVWRDPKFPDPSLTEDGL